MIFLGIIFLSMISCGRDMNTVEPVKPSDSDEKTVVVHCVIHAQYPDWPKSSFSQYAREANLQRLYLCYNTFKNGKPEKVENAVPVLYNETMDSPIGTFERVSDYEWQLRYLPTGTVIDDNYKLYSLKYRLDITGIPGKDIISSYAEVNETFPRNYFVIDYDNTEYDSRKFTYHPFSQSDAYNFNAWLFVNSYEVLYNGATVTSTKKLTPPSYLLTDYLNCDQFNFQGKNTGYQFAIRLQEYKKKDEDGRYHLLQKPYDGTSSFIGGSISVHKTEATISYVSEDFDKFLKTGISYCAKKGLTPFSDEGLPGILPNSSTHSNIEGGIGIFGVQVVTFFADEWTSTGAI